MELATKVGVDLRELTTLPLAAVELSTQVFIRSHDVGCRLPFPLPPPQLTVAVAHRLTSTAVPSMTSPCASAATRINSSEVARRVRSMAAKS